MDQLGGVEQVKEILGAVALDQPVHNFSSGLVHPRVKKQGTLSPAYQDNLTHPVCTQDACVCGYCFRCSSIAKSTGCALSFFPVP